MSCGGLSPVEIRLRCRTAGRRKRAGPVIAAGCAEVVRVVRRTSLSAEVTVRHKTSRSTGSSTSTRTSAGAQQLVSGSSFRPGAGSAPLGHPESAG